MPLIRSLEGKGVNQFVTLPVATGQTFTAGDFLQLTSGQLTIAAAGGANVGAVLIVGQAMENAIDPNTGILKTAVNVRLALPGAWFKVIAWHSTPANAYANITQLGTAQDFRNLNAGDGMPTGSTAFAINLATTANTKCRIADFETDNYTTAAAGAWPWGIQSAGTPITGAAAATAANQYPHVWVEFVAAQSFYGAR
jgi:hypothetical protein